MTRGTTSPPPVLLGFLDGLALVAFVVVGLRSHHEESVASGLVKNTIPLLVFWFSTAAVLHTYRRRGDTWRMELNALLLNWAVAVPVALLVRTIWVGSPTAIRRIALFLAVGMAFTLLLLLVGRGLGRFVTGLARSRSAGVQ